MGCRRSADPAVGFVHLSSMVYLLLFWGKLRKSGHKERKKMPKKGYLPRTQVRQGTQSAGPARKKTSTPPRKWPVSSTRFRILGILPKTSDSLKIVIFKVEPPGLD